MKVILTQNVKGVGEKNKVLNVKDGYGRNFLIKKGFAVLADAATINKISKDEARLQNVIRRKQSELKEYAAKLSSFELNFQKKANDKGVTFEAVDAKSIASELRKNGFRFIKDSDISGTPLKQLGAHNVVVAVAADNVTIKVNIYEKN